MQCTEIITRPFLSITTTSKQLMTTNKDSMINKNEWVNLSIYLSICYLYFLCSYREVSVTVFYFSSCYLYFFISMSFKLSYLSIYLSILYFIECRSFILKNSLFVTTTKPKNISVHNGNKETDKTPEWVNVQSTFIFVLPSVRLCYVLLLSVFSLLLSISLCNCLSIYPSICLVNMKEVYLQSYPWFVNCTKCIDRRHFCHLCDLPAP